mgnify:CR=1 FL=1
MRCCACVCVCARAASKYIGCGTVVAHAGLQRRAQLVGVVRGEHSRTFLLSGHCSIAPLKAA